MTTPIEFFNELEIGDQILALEIIRGILQQPDHIDELEDLLDVPGSVLLTLYEQVDIYMSGEFDVP